MGWGDDDSRAQQQGSKLKEYSDLSKIKKTML